MHISIISPVYKAEKIVDELVKRIIENVSDITSDFEIILVEDGSHDDSWKSIERNCKKDKRVIGIKLSRNFGQHHAITCGLDYCRGDWVVLMDCDLQDCPEEIPRLYAKAQEGYDVVLARRGNRKDGLIKQLINRTFYKVFNYLTDMNYDSQVGGFRIISKRVVECFRSMREQNRFFNGLIHWMGFPTASIDVKHAERFEGKTSYTFSKLCGFAIEIITSYSDKPLKVSILVGFVMSFLSFLYGGYIFLRALFLGSSVSGWSSLVISLYFLSGVIITVLGIMSIYLGKTFSEVKKRPLYIVSKITTFNNTGTNTDELSQSYEIKLPSY